MATFSVLSASPSSLRCPPPSFSLLLPFCSPPTLCEKRSPSVYSWLLPSLNKRTFVMAGGWLCTGFAAGWPIVAAGGMVASMAVLNKARQASLAVKKGMELFVQGDVGGSMMEFDKALELDPRQRPYLWQRGLSLYYLDRFEEGAAQFRDDVAVNPNDTEEAIWCFLCEAQLYGAEEARKRLLEVGPDRRPIMWKAYQIFRDGGNPEDLMVDVRDSARPDFFCASLYKGLYHEALKNPEAAKDSIIAACCSSYGSRSGDYMAFVARVHCKCREWEL